MLHRFSFTIPCLSFFAGARVASALYKFFEYGSSLIQEHLCDLGNSALLTREILPTKKPKNTKKARPLICLSCFRTNQLATLSLISLTSSCLLSLSALLVLHTLNEHYMYVFSGILSALLVAKIIREKLIIVPGRSSVKNH
ncbi:unnamed protein product [Amoebophrya sp. A120]|nr:unnamed protein product [Amoebophrya sp. A120]|eukprot:GSA120T00014166001.1